VRACLAIGKAQDAEFLMHITPVDFAAAAVAELALSPVHADGHYHTITDAPITWREFVGSMRDQGHAIELVSMQAWYDALRAALPTHRELMPLVLAAGQDPTRNSLSDANIFSMQFDTSRLRAALANTDVVCPPLDRQLVGAYVNAIVRDSLS
jgi:hypothetical protein